MIIANYQNGRYRLAILWATRSFVNLTVYSPVSYFEDTWLNIVTRKKCNFVMLFFLCLLQYESFDTHHIIYRSLLATICLFLVFFEFLNFYRLLKLPRFKHNKHNKHNITTRNSIIIGLVAEIIPKSTE